MRTLAVIAVSVMSAQIAGGVAAAIAASKPDAAMKQTPADAGSMSAPELILAIAGADANAGALVAERCAACHSLGKDEANGIGPNLFDIVGAPVARAVGFAYSPALTALNQAGATWTFGRLDAFLENPFAAVPGTRMGFAGIPDAAERADLLAFLRTLSDDPLPFVPVMPPGGVLLAPLTLAAAQVEAGERMYRRAGCVPCHAESLWGVVDTREDGDGDGPALIGNQFARRWFGGDVLALLTALQAMPPDRPGALEPVSYIDLLAFILATNGFQLGDVALPGEPAGLAAMGFHQ
jgi:cytochrome c